VIRTEFNSICEPAPPVSAADTFEAVNRLLAEYLARSVAARSDGPGKGTEFVLELPAH